MSEIGKLIDCMAYGGAVVFGYFALDSLVNAANYRMIGLQAQLLEKIPPASLEEAISHYQQNGILNASIVGIFVAAEVYLTTIKDKK